MPAAYVLSDVLIILRPGLYDHYPTMMTAIVGVARIAQVNQFRRMLENAGYALHFNVVHHCHECVLYFFILIADPLTGNKGDNDQYKQSPKWHWTGNRISECF